MQLSSVLLTLLAVTSTTARPSFFSNSQEVIQDELKVPGENPLNFCAAPTDYLIEINNVDLTPNPPLAGKKLTIKAKGNLKERVEKGAKVNVQVKFGLITLIKQTLDLCDQVTNVDLECPLEEGPLTITKDVDLPNEIPRGGKFHVLADVTDKDDKKLTCLTAEVVFKL